MTMRDTAGKRDSLRENLVRDTVACRLRMQLHLVRHVIT